MNNLAPLSLQKHVADALDSLFKTLDGHPSQGLYELVLPEFEVPLLRKALEYTQHNQVKTARLLGISRGTLRKKMETYGIR
jgi:Fis family transcriptional regulator